LLFENTLDNYAHSNGLKDINTFLKVLFAISTMLVSLISTSPVIPLLIFFLMSFLIIFQAKTPWKFYLKFLSVPFIFGCINLIFMAIFFGLGAHILDLGIFNLAVTEDGFNLGFLLLARIMGGFSCLAFLALTTPMTELFSEFERFKIPKVVLEIAMLMYRYIFVFMNEALNMYHSQETRLGYSSLKKTYKSLGILASNLFIRTWVKGEQAYIAMESRGYDGSLKTLKFKKDIKAKNILLIVLFESVLIIGVYLTSNFKIV
jgi:cobalt/nickel transport system permease protein